MSLALVKLTLLVDTLNLRLSNESCCCFFYRTDFNSCIYLTREYEQRKNHGMVAGGFSHFILYDDDDFNDDDGTMLDGDEGENIPRPDTSFLQVSDDPNLNVFAPAYVRPKYDVGDNNDFVPFAANLNGFLYTYPSTYYDFDSVGTETDRDFWTVYLWGCYQESTEDDNDPDTDGQTTGIVDFIPDVDHISGQGALVFNELLRPKETTPGNLKSVVAAHEIGHLFNGSHEDGGLMKPGIITDYRFTGATLGKIRKIAYP